LGESAKSNVKRQKSAQAEKLAQWKKIKKERTWVLLPKK